MDISVLIFDDDQYDWEVLDNIFNSYNITHFPSNNAEFERTSDIIKNFLLQDNAKVTDLLNELARSMPQVRHIFFDINLRREDNNDHSGVKFKTEHLEKIFTGARFTLFSRFEEDMAGNFYTFNDEDYIQKGRAIEHKMRKFVQKYFPLYKKVADTNKRKQPRIKPLLSWVTGMQEKIDRDIGPPIKYIIHFLISFFLYGSLIVVTTFTAFTILPKIYNEHNIIKIIEYVFLLILPTFIIFGFLVVYQRALKQYLTAQKTLDVNFDDTGKMMEMSKRLFVSSLISYLFIMVIDLATPLPDKATGVANAASKIEYNRIYILSGIIIVLIAYYILISRHKIKTAETGK
jgi:hypothetical protein